MEQSQNSGKTDNHTSISDSSKSLSHSRINLGNIFNRKFLALLPFTCLVFLIPSAYALPPGAQCWENMTCGPSQLIHDPFHHVLDPIDAYLHPYTVVAIWGALLGVVWFSSQSPLLVAALGIIVATTAVGLNQTAIGIGMMLASVAIGVVLYQVVRQRTSVLSF